MWVETNPQRISPPTPNVHGASNETPIQPVRNGIWKGTFDSRSNSYQQASYPTPHQLLTVSIIKYDCSEKIGVRGEGAQTATPILIDSGASYTAACIKWIETWIPELIAQLAARTRALRIAAGAAQKSLGTAQLAIDVPAAHTSSREPFCFSTIVDIVDSAVP